MNEWRKMINKDAFSQASRVRNVTHLMAFTLTETQLNRRTTGDYMFCPPALTHEMSLARIALIHPGELHMGACLEACWFGTAAWLN